jgi:cytoskeleton protein RodZ
MTNLGASFKKARESKGLSLDQIARETRISTRFLTAIENEEFHLLPGGIFNRGFVRSFAQAVGLDPDQAVSDYDQLASIRDPGDIGSVTPPAPKGERYLYPIAIGVLAVAIALFYIATRESGRTGDNRGLTPPAAVQPSAPVSVQESTPTTPSPTSEPTERGLPATQTLTLDVEARERTWIKVTSDGNSVNSGEVLQPGMTRKFTAENSISISVGNAAGLTLKVNDMRLKPLGRSGEVRSVTITPANLKDLIG